MSHVKYIFVPFLDYVEFNLKNAIYYGEFNKYILYFFNCIIRVYFSSPLHNLEYYFHHRFRQYSTFSTRNVGAFCAATYTKDHMYYTDEFDWITIDQTPCEVKIITSLSFSAIMASNPRKFSEKIALHNQKQAEETAAFESIMRDVSGVTRVCQLCRS